jgi:hypothetical protein
VNAVHHLRIAHLLAQADLSLEVGIQALSGGFLVALGSNVELFDKLKFILEEWLESLAESNSISDILFCNSVGKIFDELLFIVSVFNSRSLEVVLGRLIKFLNSSVVPFDDWKADLGGSGEAKESEHGEFHRSIF